MSKKDFYQKLDLIDKVLDKEMFETLYYNEPFVCSLVLDEFKSYFNDEDFEKLERQLILMKFLKNNYPLEVSRDVITYVQNTNNSKDYEKVLLEWNYECSDFIKQYNLLQYDSSQLAFDRQMKMFYDSQRKQQEKQIDVLKDLTNSLIEWRNKNNEQK